MRTVLLTGFEPFDQDLVNPSWEAVRLLEGVQLGADVRIVARQLPCAFATAGERLVQLLAEHRPQMVIAVGLGPGRSDISIERVAINLNDARIPDNLGEQPVDTEVLPGGPAAYFGTLPSKAMVRAVREAGIGASVSQTAGTFVCNQVFYLLQHALAGSGVRSGHPCAVAARTGGGPGTRAALDGVADAGRGVADCAADGLEYPGGYH